MKIKPELQSEYDAYKELNSKDGYSRGVVEFSERWMDAMEAEIQGGKTVAECARNTSSAADTEGITGFMYGCAVQALAKFWAHGEELRRWHNLDTQIGDEGEKANAGSGVLNPAVMNLG